MNSINTKRLLLGIFIIIMPVVMITSSVYVFLRDTHKVKGVISSESYAPYFTNLPPRSINLDEEYIFKPDIRSEFRDTTVLVLEEKPDWIYLDSDGYVRGFPDKEGSYKFVFKVTDGFNSSTVIEYLLVTNE